MAQFDRESLVLLDEALAVLEAGFHDLPDAGPAPDLARLRPVLAEVAARLVDNYPYHHPLYAGQMLKPPHAVARLAYALAQFINPNNHALDGGRASSAMEREAVAAIAAMFGLRTHLGHLTSGGTFANLEALWVAGRLREGGVILASAQAHYTHARISEVLRLPCEEVAADARGCMDLAALEARLARGGVGCVVATLGTTALGAVDPLSGIIRLARQHGVRVHVDAAYGGYFALLDDLAPDVRTAFAAIAEADSVVVDPHKHGLQPYGCGCVLFADPAVGRLYAHDSPYTYFTSGDLHLGEISLECSRAGAAAVALWATQRLLPYTRDGEFAHGLAAGAGAARALHAALAADPAVRVLMPPSLDILVWSAVGPDSATVSARNAAWFEAAAGQGLHLAKLRLAPDLVRPWWPDLVWTGPDLTVLRSVLMKPAHAAWLPEIVRRLGASRPV